MFDGFDHVQVAAPPGHEEAARRFFGELLGLAELPKPPENAARGGLWFRLGDQQIHTGSEDGFRPAKKAHVALKLRSEEALHALRQRLTAAGVPTQNGNDIPAVARFFAEDPWGNRMEFTAPRSEG